MSGDALSLKQHLSCDLTLYRFLYVNELSFWRFVTKKTSIYQANYMKYHGTQK